MDTEKQEQRENREEMHRGSLYIPVSLYNSLRRLAYLENRSQSSIIEESLREYLRENLDK